MGGLLWWQMSLWLVVPLAPAMLPLVCWCQCPILCLVLLWNTTQMMIFCCAGNEDGVNYGVN
jgi:hypothetical protein